MIGHILILGIVLFMIYWIFSREGTWRRQEQDPCIPIVAVYFVSKCFHGVRLSSTGLSVVPSFELIRIIMNQDEYINSILFK